MLSRSEQPAEPPSTPLRDGELTLIFIEFAPHRVHHVPTYHFRMADAKASEEFGSINLRVASTPHIESYAGHIGFNVYPAHRGRRYAARSVRLLIPFARQLGFDSLWITCDPDNQASRRSLEIAGADLIEIVDVPPDCIIYQSGHPKKCRYRLHIGP